MKSLNTNSSSRSRGALRVPGPLLLCFPLVSMGIAIAWLQGRPATRGSFPTPPASVDATGQPTWVTPATGEPMPDGKAGTCEVRLRMAPLHRDAGQQQFESKVMRERFDLAPGQPWQLRISLPADCDAPLDLSGLRLQGAGGSILPLDLTPPGAGSTLHDPVRVLFDGPDELKPGEEWRFVVWGPSPGESLRLLGLGREIQLVQENQVEVEGQMVALGSSGRTPEESPKTPKAAAWAAEKQMLELEILRLRGELENALEDRVARESEYVAWSTMLSEMLPQNAPPEIYSLIGSMRPAPEPDPETEPDPVLELKRQRSKEVYLDLRALMVVERLDSLDLLEAGMVELGYTGPVVFRQLDERGRPVGTLCADRLRLEGSRIARTLTIVLEDGYERLGGQTLPFEGSPPDVERGGTRRIFLQNTDPRPWFESAPELFREQSLEVLQDDGTWQLFLVHRKLNELLSLDAALGFYKVVQVAGILENQLRGVELEQLDRDGRLVKRLFADRLTIQREPKGMMLLLEDGIQMQGASKLAFLEGRYRIYLPSADQIQWTTAGLPGLTSAAESPMGTGRAR